MTRAGLLGNSLGVIPPETQYTKLGDSMIAYQVFGDGPIDLLVVNGIASHVDVWWENPPAAHFYERLASFARVIVFDGRGTGASDPVQLDALPTWEDWTEDVHAVLDAVSSARAVIWARFDGALMAMLFAATYPGRTSALVLWNTTARWNAAADYSIGLSPQASDAFLAAIVSTWGSESVVVLADPTMSQNEQHRRWAAKLTRGSMTPRSLAVQMKSRFEIDARAVLPLIRVPALVMHRSACPFPSVEHGRYIAEHIPGGRFVEIPGTDLSNIQGADVIADETEEFLTGIRRSPELDRVLATVLFTDIVDSTHRASSLGDRRWKELLDHHDETIKSKVDLFGGRLIKTTGDGMLATFDGPSKAIRCAFEIMDAFRPLEIALRAGLHTGEIELRAEDDIGGIAVHIGSRVMTEAGSSEVVCSRTVKDLVAGAGFGFEDRGLHALKGIPDEWQLFTVTRPI